MNSTKRPLLSDSAPIVRHIILFSIIISGTLFVWFLGSVLVLPLFDLNPSDLPNINNIKNINVLKYLQVVQTLAFFLVPTLLFTLLYHRSFTGYLKLNISPRANSLLLVILITIFAIPVINLLTQGNIYFIDSFWGEDNYFKTMQETYQVTIDRFLDVKSTWGLLFNLFMIAVLPAVCEEFLFRGIIQQTLNKLIKNVHVSIFIAAFFFSFVHFEFYGFIPRLLIGMMFGYLFAWSGNLWLPITAHFLNNGISVIAMWLVDRQELPEQVETFGMNSKTMIWSVLCLLITGFLLYYFYLKEKRVLHRT